MIFRPGTWVRIKLRDNMLASKIHPWSLDGRIGQVIKVQVDGPGPMIPRYQLKMLDGGEVYDVPDYKLEAVTATEVDIEYHRLRMKIPDKIQGIQINATYQDEVMTFESEMLYRNAIAALRRYQGLRESEDNRKEDIKMPEMKLTLDAKKFDELKTSLNAMVERVKKLPEAIPPKYVPERIIYNDPATIIFWQDKTKTVVKRSPNEPFNKYSAFCAALAKKMYGCNSRVNKIVNSGIIQKKPEEDITKKASVSKIRRKNSDKADKAHKELIDKILRMKTKSHMSYTKIANTLNIPESTVRDLMKEAKEAKK